MVVIVVDARAADVSIDSAPLLLMLTPLDAPVILYESVLMTQSAEFEVEDIVTGVNVAPI